MQCSALLSLSLALLSWVPVARSQNCQLQVPPNPLTAQGLATPYVLTGCNQLDFANQGAFVEAAILDPATGNIQIYNPLVINAGMTPVGNGTGTSSTSAGTTTGMATSSASTNNGETTTPSATASSGTGTGTSTTDATTTTGTPTATSTNDGATTMASTDASSAASSTVTSGQAAATMAARQATSPGFYIPPIVPTLPNNAVVGIWFGSNAASLTLTGNTDGCINGLGNSVFGQFAYCNGQAWFHATNAAVNQGLIKLPAPGTGSGGQACPTTHDFRVVDQDQSDNVVTTYLLIGNNTLAQNSPDNNKANPNAEVLSNASDNALITQFIDPALGCAPYQNPCQTCPNGQSPALATDELLANFFPPVGGPALIPLNDPMVLVNGQSSLQKVNLYRDGTGQPHADNNNASGLTYCQQISQSGIFINDNQQLFSNAGSPAPNTANNLFTFLAMRFSASFGPAPGLGCTGLLNVANPVTLTMDGNGVVTAATINTQELQQILGGGTGNTATTASASSASASAPASTGATSVSAGTSSAGSSASPPPTGVLLHPTGTSSMPTASPTNTPGSATSDSVSASATAASSSCTQGCTTAVSTPVAMTSAAGSVASSMPTCSSAVTVTVTVTATACPTQVSASPTACDDAGDGGWNGGWNHGRHHQKRSIPFTADRLRRKSRIASFH